MVAYISLEKSGLIAPFSRRDFGARVADATVFDRAGYTTGATTVGVCAARAEEDIFAPTKDR
jgi:hypothetical protein